MSGLHVERLFTHDKDPFDTVIWVKRDSVIKNAQTGEIVFEMPGVEVPEHWSQMATDILASKYFRKAGCVPAGTYEDMPEYTGERSLKQVVTRMAGAWRYWGTNGKYFDDYDDADNFEQELKYMLIHQMAAPNSPQWFNTGLNFMYDITGPAQGHYYVDPETNEAKKSEDAYTRAQVHICYIQSIEDDLVNEGGIMDLWSREARIFKYGSGTGTNFSNLRGKGEPLSGGGTSSGLISFLRVGDRAAGAIKSGGTCLAPDTRVYTSHGPVKVKDLAESGQDFITLSYDPPAGRYKAKIARAWLAGEKEVVRITTDKGYFDVSFDHPMRLSNHQIVRAGDLAPGQSMLACTIDRGNKNYLRVGLHDGKKGKATLHSLVAKDVLGWELSFPEKIVHHIDENVDNSDPSNLELQSQSFHASYHNSKNVTLGNHVFVNQKFPKAGIKNGMHQGQSFWQDDERATKYRETQRRILESSGRAKGMQKMSSRQRMMNLGYELINSGFDISTFKNYCTARKKVRGKFTSVLSVKKGFGNNFGSYDNFLKELSLHNHRIVSVDSIGTMPVYDVEVDCPTLDDKTPESGHNFVIWCGDEKTGSGVVALNTRRAAKMVILNVDHPDIEEFIDWKVEEEKKAQALIAAGYPSDYNGAAYDTISGQNANNSIRISDAFMQAVENDDDWNLTRRTDGSVHKTVKARDLWNKIAHAAWLSADPGVQYDDTINAWHMCPESGRINGSNPCCFTGDTLVDTSEGPMRFDVLAEMAQRGDKLPYAFAFDEKTGLPVLRQIKNVWIAGLTKELVEVRTQRGMKIRSTPEHRYLLRSGEWVEAQQLQYNQSLRKIGRWVNKARSNRHYINHKETEQVSNGTIVQSRFMWEQVYGSIPEGLEVHHKNDDPTDDRLSNFELRPMVDHRVYHSSGENNGRYINVEDHLLVEHWDYVQSHHGKVTVSTWNTAKKETQSIVPIARYEQGVGIIRGLTWEKFSEYIDSKRVFVNDKVESVERVSLLTRVPVFDLEVEGVHNFGVMFPGQTHSLIVHNSEFMFLDNTACNLASINLTKFLNYDGSFNTPGFVHACRLWTLVLEISVYMAQYPSEQIARMSYDFRPLGLGYANLGAMLMQKGLPYDSEEARSWATSITSLMTAVSYTTSAEMAKHLGPFPEYETNSESMKQVIWNHRAMHNGIKPYGITNSFITQPYEDNQDVYNTATDWWTHATHIGDAHGYRNAQATLLAPTGTIGLVMDCDTTGIEPEFSLLKYKKLAGGGDITIINQSVSRALDKLGYIKGILTNIQPILSHIETKGTIEGAPGVDENDYAVFDTANKGYPNGTRYIAPEGHLLMMAAVQPFLSGAISKTVNLPEHVTVEDVAAMYKLGWELGLKAVAIYRDGSKMSVPLSVKKQEEDKRYTEDDMIAAIAKAHNEARAEALAETPGLQRAERNKLPAIRSGKTHEFSIAGQKVYLRTGEYPDGTLGEIFVDVHKEGAAFRSLMNCFAIAVSKGLQYGVPVDEYVESFAFTKFEPQGLVTNHPNLKMAGSIIDAVFRIVGFEYEGMDELVHNKEKFDVVTLPGEPPGAEYSALEVPVTLADGSLGLLAKPVTIIPKKIVMDAPFCHECGHLTVRSGTCFKCMNCGSTTGCS